jgi:hypothetical protein
MIRSVFVAAGWVTAATASLVSQSAAAQLASVYGNYLINQNPGQQVNRAEYSYSNDPNYNGTLNVGIDISGSSAWSTVDIRSGTVRAYANSVVSASTTINAGFSDIFRFNIPGAATNTVTRFGLQAYFYAVLTNGQVNTRTTVSGLQSGDQIVQYVLNNSTNASNAFRAVMGEFGEFRPVEVFGLQHYGATANDVLWFDVIGANPQFTLRNETTIFVGDRGLIDFSNSGHLAFILPDDVTFTSAGGNSMIINAIPGGVPEPASWAMLIGGLGLVGAVARRKRRVSASA